MTLFKRFAEGTMDVVADKVARRKGRARAKGGGMRATDRDEQLKSACAAMEDGAATARTLASSVGAEERLGLARAVVFRVVSRYWKAAAADESRRWPLREPSDLGLGACPPEAEELSERVGKAAATLDPVEAGYRIGVVYTAMMPQRVRSELGAYYTPPALCERLLDMATEAGTDWATARVLDPACGGGAFLAPVARRMAAGLDGSSPESALAEVERRLRGFEVDPFAAWMSEVFLEAALEELCRRAGRRLRSVVTVCDSLEQAAVGEGYDLVVGNPPYGRVKLSGRRRGKFADSLFGHANLYGVFTDQALRLARAGGLIAYVTPTSFLAGEYFKALRRLLAREAPPAKIGFVGERKGVFADVLQETLLAVYRRGGDAVAGTVDFISAGVDGSMETRCAGSFMLPDDPCGPWLMPRTERQVGLLRRVGTEGSRLADLGYTVSTGPLVWNRHKDSLRVRRREGCYPLLWAESVRPEGGFEFRAAKRNHKPYFRPKADERWVVTDFSCVLLQRTTAKEQCRRLIAAELPAAFVEAHGAVVVENHLNMIKPGNGAPKVAPAALAAVLNSEFVDQLFRCINGSVAVSAYELEALPLPSLEAMGEFERVVGSGATGAALEQAVARAYGCEDS